MKYGARNSIIKSKAVLITGIWFLAIQGLPAGGAKELTPAATAAVKGRFPTGSIVAVNQEREQGVRYFEVALKDGERRVEIEVTAEGTIGEIESAVAIEDVPELAREAIRTLTAGGSVEAIEWHEVHGEPWGNAFVPVDPARTFYEVKSRVNGAFREFAIGLDGNALAPERDDDGDAEDGDADD
jgi:hypothetical protein